MQSKPVVPTQEIHKPAVVQQQQRPRPSETSLTSEKQPEKSPVPPSHDAQKNSMALQEPVRTVKNEKPVVYAPTQGLTATSESRQKTPVSDDSVRRNYFASIRASVEQRKEYPLLARRKKLEGTVVARFTLSRNGRLQNVEIAKSSNESILDNAAVNAIKSVQLFHPAPLEVKGENIQIEVPLTFRIAGQ
jgi:protein TonB